MQEEINGLSPPLSQNQLLSGDLNPTVDSVGHKRKPSLQNKLVIKAQQISSNNEVRNENTVLESGLGNLDLLNLEVKANSEFGNGLENAANKNNKFPLKQDD